MSRKSQAQQAGDSSSLYVEQVGKALAGSGLFVGKATWRGPSAVLMECRQSRDAFSRWGTQYQGLVLSDAPLCVNLFGQTLSAEFIVWRAEWPEPLALFVRVQEESGTAEQKLPFLVESLFSFNSPSPMACAVVLAGDRFGQPDSGAAAYVRRQAESRTRLLAFIGMAAFLTWVNRGMILSDPPGGAPASPRLTTRDQARPRAPRNPARPMSGAVIELHTPRRACRFDATSVLYPPKGSR